MNTTIYYGARCEYSFSSSFVVEACSEECAMSDKANFRHYIGWPCSDTAYCPTCDHHTTWVRIPCQHGLTSTHEYCIHKKVGLHD